MPAELDNISEGHCDVERVQAVSQVLRRPLQSIILASLKYAALWSGVGCRHCRHHLVECSFIAKPAACSLRNTVNFSPNSVSLVVSNHTALWPFVFFAIPA